MNTPDTIARYNFNFFGYLNRNAPISSRTRAAEAEKQRPKPVIFKPAALSEHDPIARRTRGAYIKRAEQLKKYNQQINN